MARKRSKMNWKSAYVFVWIGAFTLSLVQFLAIYMVASHNDPDSIVDAVLRRQGSDQRYLGTDDSGRQPLNAVKSSPPQSGDDNRFTVSKTKESLKKAQLHFQAQTWERFQRQQHIYDTARKEQTQKTADTSEWRAYDPDKVALDEVSVIAKKKTDTIRGKHSLLEHSTPVDDDNVMTPALKAGKMYSLGRLDRSGSVISDMLYAHAFAFFHNITYAGACHTVRGLPKKDTVHLLEDLHWTHILPFACPPGVDQNHAKVWHPNATELSPLILSDDVYRQKIDRTYFTATWREHIHKLMSQHVDEETHDHSRDRPYEIAVHVRRGDVSPCKNIRRYLTNTHYLQLIDQFTPPAVERDNRPVHVTVYSESDSFEPFDVFRERNYTVELDTNDLAVIWRSLLTADLAILSRSFFSFVPAALCRGTVVATQFSGFEPLEGWIEADEALVKATDREIRRLAKLKCYVTTEKRKPQSNSKK